MGSVYVIGDLHGQLEKLSALLMNAGLVDGSLEWQGGEAILIFIGDFFDRGPDGVGCLELAMRLQEQARRVGGEVQALLGNHEILTIAAYRFKQRLTSGPGGTFVEDWQHNGGQLSDLQHLEKVHIDWMSNLPGMLLLQDHLLIHADATFYLRYGSSVNEVNRTFHDCLYNQQTASYEQLLRDFNAREAFMDDELGVTRCYEMLKRFGGRRIVHGHTPIARLLGRRGSEVRSPLVYAGGLAVNVDGGLYMGGEGFVYKLPDLSE